MSSPVLIHCSTSFSYFVVSLLFIWEVIFLGRSLGPFISTIRLHFIVQCGLVIFHVIITKSRHHKNQTLA
ncbi:hypothetical protein AP053_gp192 [Ostreococcus mediterraneus virus 1]|uniref:hypothetical protein n=1 Tax=Ostreococcus mediterraneus virus 1 TaxID=1663210 RepID=UPI0006D2B75A|nr:hypothetical protein AP053_gp192 [Ostreococcus mediterraneus virus 1]ALI95353.1 hypothetical protein OmV1_242c [Ostreococcus mediterraneus virus 1]